MSASGGVEHAQFGIAVGVGATATVAATIAAAILFPPTNLWARLVVVCLAAGGVTGTVDIDARASLVTAGLGWLLFTGFVANRYGELSWDRATSGWQLAAFATATAVGVVARRLRFMRSPRSCNVQIPRQLGRRDQERYPLPRE